MSRIDHYSDVLNEDMRAVWPALAEAVRTTDGVLMGGTAVAIHLRHRTSDDLDVMTTRPFDARSVADKLKVAFAESYEEDEVAANTVTLRVNGVLVQVFQALAQETRPEEIRILAQGTAIAGLLVGSLPDLLAAKLDVIMYRPKIRDYVDLAALDRLSPYTLEDGLTFWSLRYGHRISSRLVDRIVSLLEDPGRIPADHHFTASREQVLAYLSGRARDLRSHLATLRLSIPPEEAGPSLKPKRPEGGLLRNPLADLPDID